VDAAQRLDLRLAQGLHLVPHAGHAARQVKDRRLRAVREHGLDGVPVPIAAHRPVEAIRSADPAGPAGPNIRIAPGIAERV